MQNLLRIAVLCQVVGMGCIWVLDRSAIGKYFFSYTPLDDGTVIIVGNALLGVLLAVATGVWLRPAFAFLICGLVFFFEAISIALIGGNFASSFAPVAQITRWGVPLAAGLFGMRLITPINFKGFLRWACAGVFVVHGIEALLMHPTFIDYIIDGSTKFGLPFTQRQAEWALIAIGVLDIVCGVIVVVAKGNYLKAALLYMIVWGAWTSFVRTLYGGWYGVGDTLVRAMNWAGPLLLYFMHYRGGEIYEESKGCIDGYVDCTDGVGKSTSTGIRTESTSR